MTEHERLAECFEEHRSRLRAVAHRMLGSAGEADDAVQEAWLRLHRSDVTGVRNLGGWLTTVVGRVCLDMLRSRTARREEPLGLRPPETAGDQADGPEHEALLADSLGVALLVVLDTLAPAERLALVLHDMFAVPYREIAPIVGRTPSATKMLASRARRRIQAAEGVRDTGSGRGQDIVGAFLAASRDGDFEALLVLLHPGAVLRSDRTAAQLGAAEASGAAGIARRLSGRARGARPALLDGGAGAAWSVGGELRAVFSFTIADGRITAIDVIADPWRLARIDVEFLPAA
ncbi:sigma-70 family RNA polymerase sigma factor [Actinomadura darangshiensis]|uniref:Sigma-70 family RNA polymerase sigma factor n=1 Tax=Actinomadura darangshiensis TaxID=705336 RepID=A0A4V2YUH0_9ACTN|nr:sigma-70 family RNA polymerase sigma factor [Actinomadura darangshiensis]TDD77787.1 sigma-70 family RNA polymerase sigma factor [Actinomadura darangshiensis]